MQLRMNILWGAFLTILASFSMAVSQNNTERIVNRQDTDRVFGLNKSEWNEQAKHMFHPDGWIVRTTPLDTGTVLSAYDRRSGIGLSVQPFFPDTKSPPDIVIIGNYYPAGALPHLNQERQREIEADAQADLGPDYAVRVTYAQSSSAQPLDVIEIIITKSAK